MTSLRIKRALKTGVEGYDAVMGRGPWFTHQPLGSRIDPDGIAGYYCDLRFKAEWATRWGDGFPTDGPGRPPLQDVIPVTQAALGYWELQLEGWDTGACFMRLADWLIETARETSVGLAWQIPYAVPKYGLSPGWTSALGQGQAISVLLRAHAGSGDGRYLDAARAARGPLARDVAEGGLARVFDGHTVLEEYPTATPCVVLNGWIYALLGIHELAVVTGDRTSRRMVDEGAAAVVALLPRYDIGWWSLYSLYDQHRRDLAKPFYQRLHPVLLRALALVRPLPELLATADRWEAQLTSRATARATAAKVGFRLSKGRRASRLPRSAASAAR